MVTSVIMPPCHGKTTFHNPSRGIIDAGELVGSKIALRAARQSARETGNWAAFDEFWCQQILTHLPENALVLMVPHVNIARACQIPVNSAIILPYCYILEHAKRRPKSGVDYALEMREEALLCGVTIQQLPEYASVGEYLDQLTSV